MSISSEVRVQASRMGRRVNRSLSNLLVVFGVSLLIYGVKAALLPVPTLTVVDPNRFLHGASDTFTFGIHNNTWHEIRIIGTSDRCSPIGCSLTKPIPLIIPAGETRNLEILFKSDLVNNCFRLKLFTSDASQPEITLTFSN